MSVTVYTPAENQLQNEPITASHLSDVLSHVLDHHFISSNGLHRKQTPVVDERLAESDLFLTELKERKCHFYASGKLIFSGLFEMAKVAMTKVCLSSVLVYCSFFIKSRVNQTAPPPLLEQSSI